MKTRLFHCGACGFEWAVPEGMPFEGSCPNCGAGSERVRPTSDIGRLGPASAPVWWPAQPLREWVSADCPPAAETEDPTCLLDANGVIRFVNNAWDQLAEANAGAPGALGSAVLETRWLDHVSGRRVQAHYARLLQAVLGERGSRGVVEVCECNTPELARIVMCRFQPMVWHHSPARPAIAVVYHTLRAAPIERTRAVVEGEEAAYRDRRGRLVACSSCRRARCPRTGRWDFVPEMLRRPPWPIAFEFCRFCAVLYRLG